MKRRKMIIHMKIAFCNYPIWEKHVNIIFQKLLLQKEIQSFLHQNKNLRLIKDYNKKSLIGVPEQIDGVLLTKPITATFLLLQIVIMCCENDTEVIFLFNKKNAGYLETFLLFNLLQNYYVSLMRTETNS